MITTETVLVIPFHDVDSMNVVWHGRYFKYFEIARERLLDSFDYGYREMFESGYAWPIVDARIKFIKPLKWQQEIVVVCTIKEWEYRLKINYLIKDAGSGERITKGHTIQIAVDMNTEEMCYESPPILKQKLDGLL